MIEAKLQSATKSSRKSDAAMHLFNPEELDFGRESSASTIATHDTKKSRSPSLGNDTVIGGASVEDASPLTSNDLINNV
jgi:hypothetical protein